MSTKLAILSLVVSAGLAAPAAAQIIVGAGAGAGPHVKVIAASGLEQTFMAFSPTFAGGVRVAGGDVNGDGTADIIVGAGPGAPGGHVKVFDGRTGAEIRSFYAFEQAFLGGVSVGSGDIDGDGFDDIIVGSGINGHVKAFSGLDGSLLRSFQPYGAGYLGGVRVAAGDMDGDGRIDIVTGADANGHVKVFDGARNSELASFFAFPGFLGEVSVATMRLGGHGRDLLIGGAGLDVLIGNTGADRMYVKVFDVMTGELVRSFIPFTPSFTGGVNVASADVNGDGSGDIIVGMADYGTWVSTFDGATGTRIRTFLCPSEFGGGVFVGGLRSISPPCSADFDRDGDTGTDADIEAFFRCLGGDCCATCGSADFDGDGDTGTDADIEAFFRVLGGGGC